MLFVTLDSADRPPVPRRTPASRRRRVAEPAGRGCDACPLRDRWTHLSSPVMPMETQAESDILIMGEAPGKEEDERGRPFVGSSGQLLRRLLPSRESERLAYTNAVRCRPPDNRNPAPREITACSIHLEEDVAAGRFKAILGLGGVPLSYFINEAGITQIHGFKFPVEIAGKTLWYFPAFHPAFVGYMGGRNGGKSPALPIFENDLRTFFKGVDRWPEPRIERPDPQTVIEAFDEQHARRVWAAMNRRRAVGMDIETSGLRAPAAHSAILTAAVSDGAVSLAWPVCHPQAANDWGLRFLLEITRETRWVAHNAGFELAWLTHHARRAGIDWYPEAGFDDSMAAARLFQKRETCLNLGVLTRIYLGTNIKKLSSVNTEEIAAEPLPEVLKYNGLDAWGCYRIHERLIGHVSRADYNSILETVESVTEMHLEGLDVDDEAARLLAAEWSERGTAAAEHARRVYEVRQYERMRQTGFNLGSPEQVGEALVSYGKLALPKNSDGTYKTDDNTLNQLAADNPLARDTLEYRHAKKMLATYVQPLLAAADAPDRRIHPSYSTMLTKTYRLSSEHPNIQNFPKRKDRELRTPIIPPRGCLWASADYGQLEARVYGMASKDRALCRSIIDDEDIHSHWLNIVLDAYPPYWHRLAQKVTPNETEAHLRKGGRDIIKSDLVFASFYGATARNAAERVGLPMHIANEILDRFWQRYQGAARWLRARRDEYMSSGISRNLCGVERYGLMLGNEPINNPIQSTAARIVLEAQNELYRLYRQHRDPHLLPRINIHDDLTFALPDGDDDLLMAYIEIISEVLVKVRFPWQIVPLKVEWKIGANWAQLYDVHEHTGDYVR